MNKINIVWFKRDLRIVDHAPLMEASKHGIIIPLYVLEPELWRLPDSSRRHWHFIHDSLVDLQKTFLEFDSSLCICIDEITKVLQNFKDRFGMFNLWSHEETGNNWTYQRDLKVAEWCKANSINWHEFPSNGVVRRLKNRDGWSNLRDTHMSAPIIYLTEGFKSLKGLESQPLPAKNHPMFGDIQVGTVQAGGRIEGLKTLNSFLKERGKRYMQSISRPGVSEYYCSRLSTHITFGTLSVREIEHATKKKIKSLSEDNSADSMFYKRNLSAFLSRLAWHCHFIQKLEQQPEIEFKCMHGAFEGMREPHFREDFFNAWKTGHTGYPLIDACMRSLHKNGWITFRMRAMLVSFASYHLWLDWRQTAPFLAQLFTDYEPGIHYSQFQMQSGVTGINAIRMYNPIKQSTDHDPEGKFLRLYLPEIKHLSNIDIHEPWKMDAPPPNYPPPIVDHQTAIRYARSEISKRWKSDNFREISHEVNKKLGSRNRPTHSKKPKKKIDTQQLCFEL